MTPPVLSRALPVRNKCENLEELVLVTPVGLVDPGSAVAFFKSLMHDNSQVVLIGYESMSRNTHCLLKGGESDAIRNLDKPIIG
jgi:predicted metal-dependent RNase